MSDQNYMDDQPIYTIDDIVRYPTYNTFDEMYSVTDIHATVKPIEQCTNVSPPKCSWKNRFLFRVFIRVMPFLLLSVAAVIVGDHYKFVECTNNFENIPLPIWLIIYGIVDFIVDILICLFLIIAVFCCEHNLINWKVGTISYCLVLTIYSAFNVAFVVIGIIELSVSFDGCSGAVPGLCAMCVIMVIMKVFSPIVLFKFN